MRLLVRSVRCFVCCLTGTTSVFDFHHFYARHRFSSGHASQLRNFGLCAEWRASERVPGLTRRESGPKYRRVDRAAAIHGAA